MPETIVETQNLTKRYGNFTALSDLSLSIERGSIYGFIGPNGAGKTTTMRILATLLEPSGGQAWVAGYPRLPARRLQQRSQDAHGGGLACTVRPDEAVD